MFEYFRGNYVWNLATNLTLGSGGLIGEIDTVARSIVDAGLRNDDPAQEEWVQAFMRLAGHVHEQARRDEQAGHLQSAGRKLMRAANYYFAAERQTHPKDPRKTMLYKTMLECFQRVPPGAASRSSGSKSPMKAKPCRPCSCPRVCRGAPPA